MAAARMAGGVVIVMQLTDFSGLLGYGIAAAAMGVLIGGRFLPARVPHRSRILGAMGLVLFVLMLAPIFSAPVATWPRGAFGDFSITSLVLLLLAMARRVGTELPFNQQLLTDSRPALVVLLAATCALFYPLALGLDPGLGIGLFDPYRLGYASPVFIAALLLLAAFALWRRLYLIPLVISLAILAWSIRWHESPNLWDYLLDPFLGFYVLGVCIKTMFSYVKKFATGLR